MRLIPVPPTMPPCAAPAPLQQTAQFARAVAAMGRQVRHLRVMDGSTPIADICALRRFGGLWFASRGPVWHGDPSVDALSLLRRRGLCGVNAETGDDPMRAAGYRRIITPATIAELPLDRPDWRGRAHGKWRNQLRRAEALIAEQRMRVTHRAFCATPDGWILTACADQARRRRYRDLPPAFTLAYAAVNPKDVQVFSLTQTGAAVAAIVVLRHGTTASYHLAWSNDAGRAVQAHRALLARAADWLAQQGCVRFDLGTINTEDAPGLARFKIGTGAVMRRLGGTWMARPRVTGPGL